MLHIFYLETPHNLTLCTVIICQYTGIKYSHIDITTHNSTYILGIHRKCY